MSRLWRERLLVSLEPSALSWLRLAGIFAPRITAKRTIETDPAFGKEPWDGALAALGAEAQRWKNERVDVAVVLSNHFVRYAIVPPTEGVHGADEELALARFHFVRIHGERAKSWQLRLSPARPGAPRLACATDAGLVESLRSCLPKYNSVRFVSLQPYLMSAFNRSRSKLPKEGAWLLLAEPGRCCLALFTNGAWAAVQSVKGRFDSPEEWLALLERERLRAPANPIPRTVLVRAASKTLAGLRDVGSWQLVALGLPALPGFFPIEDERYIMALTAR